MVHRIAVASTNGTNIDLHFAQAHQFYIYDVEDDGHTFVEIRTSTGISWHDENEFDKKVALLHDCSSVFVSRIGYGAARYLSSRGIRIFEAPYPIEAVLDKLVKEQILFRK